MYPKDWLNHYLTHQDRQTLRNSRQPLYRYAMNDDEYKTLQTALKNNTANITRISDWNAVFVIYAAEWWRREYDGHSWTWAGIFQSFGADVQNLSTEERNQLVKNGLQYWRREVRIINGSKRYLGTIATEGGLPLNQLTNAGTNGGWLGMVLKQAIPKYLRLQTSGVEASEIISEYERIPKTYRNSQIYSILGDMVQTVVALKKEHQLHTRNNPVDYLDRHNPPLLWREKFPLPINNEIGTKLLSDMVETVAKADELPVIPFRSIRVLNNDFQLKTQFEFLKFIELEAIFQDKIENIPSRLEVELFSDENQTIKLGYAQKTIYKDKSSLKMPCVSYSVHNEKAYSIRFKHLSETIALKKTILCEELDHYLPWTFVSKNDQWQLEGVASIRTRADKVRILYPDNLSCGNEVKTIANLGNKILIEASGIIKLVDTENSSYIIKTNSQVTERYYLQGNLLNFSSNPKELYLGLPKLWSINNETEIHKPISRQLIARPINSKTNWAVLNAKQQGIYEIRLQDDEGIEFRKRCVLLPENFTIRLKPEANTLNGVIYLENTGNTMISCDSYQIIRDDDNNSYEIKCYSEKSPPAYVSLTLSWAGIIQTAELKIPFPARGGQLIDPDGNITRQVLYQDRLHGFRLRLINENPNVSRNLKIQFTLNNKELNDKDLYFRDEIKREGTVINIAIIDYLEWIKNLFSLSKLDGTIKLTVDEGGSELLKSIEISRYQLSPKRNEADGCIFLTASDHATLTCDEISKIQLMAMRLSQPEQEHSTLKPKFSEQTETGSWFFYPEKRVPEPWLIYSAKDSSIFLRPILWIGTNEQKTVTTHALKIQTLHNAVTLDNPKLRGLVISKILLTLCFDFKHSGWEYLKNLWKQCPHLPLSSFDVWLIAVKYPIVLVALALQMDKEFINKLSEELPVFWELIPLKHWLAVFSYYKSYVEQIIDDETEVKEILEIRINLLISISVSMEMVSRILKYMLCNINDPELGYMNTPNATNMVVTRINEVQQELNRRQADSHWLTLLQSEIIGRWQRLEENQQRLLKLESEHKHRLSVILLPVLLAVFFVKGTQNIVSDTPHIFKLKQLKYFDEDWFNTAFQFSLAYLSQLPEHKTQLEMDATKMTTINDDEIERLNKEIEEITGELKEQTDDLKANTDTLERDFEQFKDVNDELELLRMDNEELKQRLLTAEEQHEYFVNALRATIKKRDDLLKSLLQEVKILNTKINEIRSSLINKNN